MLTCACVHVKELFFAPSCIARPVKRRPCPYCKSFADGLPCQQTSSPERVTMTDFGVPVVVSQSRLARIRNGLTPKEWTGLGGMGLTVVGLNVLGWGLLSAALGGHFHVNRTETFGVGTGVLAYTLGMRHAFDADHIAAIDNTTRKLINDGQRPLSVGFFFSLGHSTVVFALAVLLNFGIRSLDEQVKNGSSALQSTTNVIGTSVSGFFLYLIAALNIIVLLGIVQVYRQMRSGYFDDAELERQLDNRGFMNRFLGGYARRIESPWKMYPVG